VNPEAVAHSPVITSDGLTLESRWDLPQGTALATVVLCHPHPLLGGTMNLPLLRTVAAAVVSAGGAVLRFNFRGTGGSQGSWGGGDAEVGDVAAAFAAAAVAFPAVPPALAGWSFGAVVALRWQAEACSTAPYVGIAPAADGPIQEALPNPSSLAPAPRLFLLGDGDQYTAVADLTEYAAAARARIEVLPGIDHFFFARESRVADAVVGHLGLPLRVRSG
jgi:alpha/beta superfamily hydrolase